MKRLKRFYLSVLLVLTLTLGFGVCVNAESEGNGSETGEGTAKPDENSATSGYSRMRSGYLIYITDAAGKPVSPIRLVPYSSQPSSKVKLEGLTTRVTNTYYNDIYNGTISSATNGGYTKPPLNTSTGEGFGESFKRWCLSKSATGDANVFILITNLFGDSYAKSFSENDYYLCIEGIAWLGLKSSPNPSILVAGTTKTLNQIFQKVGSDYRENIRMMRLPHSAYLEYSWAGCVAPIIHQNKRESMADLTADGNGYGMIMVRSKEVTPIKPEDPEPPVEISADDYLKANELNYIFPDFIPSDKSGRSAEHYSLINDGKNKINMSDQSNWLHLDSEELYDQCKLHNGVWQVLETITSDAVNFYGKNNCLFYRALSGNWKKPLETKEFSENAGDVYPGYSYLISRPLWNDNLVVCDYRGNGKVYEDFITNTLKYKLGHNGSSTGITGGSNTEAKISTTKSASYTFKGLATEDWKFNDKIHHDAEYGSQLNSTTGQYEQVEIKAAYDEDNWVDGSGDIEQKVPVAQITYNLVHGLYKYTPFANDVVANEYAGETAYRYCNLVGSSNKVVFTSQFNTELSMYPEVEYNMYYTDTKEEYKTPQEVKVFCMGEEARKALPASLHGYKVVYSSGMHMKGRSLLQAPLTGTNAYDFAKSFGDNSQEYMQVMPSGSPFETASLNFCIVNCTSFTLDLYDGNLGNNFNPKNEWQSGNPQVSHDAFVSAIYDNIEPEVSMKRYLTVSSTSPFGEAYNMSFDYNKSILDTHTEQIRLEYRDGKIVKGRTELLQKISEAYGVSSEDAEVILQNWGLEQELDNMLESSSDSNNNSGVEGITTSHWYDEESICFAITINNSVIKVGDILFDDKSDYGSSTSQSPTDITSVGKNGVQARFYFTLKFIKPSISVDGFDFDLSDKMYLIKEDEMQGARFLISNSTTHDWLN